MKLGLSVFTALAAFQISGQVAKQPDLVVESIYLDGQCFPHAVIANIGTAGIPATAYASQDALVYINLYNGSYKFLKANQADPQKLLMAPGGRIDLILQQHPVEGSATFFVNLNSNPNPAVIESNYANNKLQKQLTCASIPEPGNPKIEIIDFKVVPGCNLEVQLKNVGPGRMPFDAYVYPNQEARFLSISTGNAVYINKWLHEIDPEKKLRNENGSLTFIVDMSHSTTGLGAGTNPLLTRRDIKLVTSRLDHEEPTHTKTKSLHCAPDLSLEVTFAPANPLAGEYFVGTAKIRNVGYQPTPATTLNWRIGGGSNQPVYSVPPLQPGQSTSVARGETFDTPLHYVSTAILDEPNAIAELAEGNNQAVNTITVLKPGQPDFEVVDITTMSPLVADQPITIKARLKNSGTAIANLYYYMRVGGEALPTPTIAHNVHPGQMISISRMVRFDDPGNYGIRVVVDPQNQVAESNEANNQLVKTITIR